MGYYNLLTYMLLVSTLTKAEDNSFAKIGKFFGIGGSDKTKVWSESKAVFEHELRLLQKEFKAQSRETWIQLEATIGNTLQAEPPQHPAVITVLAPPTVNTDFSACFARKLALIVNKAFVPILQDNGKPPSPLVLTNSTFDKLTITEIRNNIDYYFQHHGKSLVVLEIDQFRNENNLMMFHGLCDNYHAVDVRATILFPVKVSQEVFESVGEWTHDRGGAISNEVLTRAWKDVVRSNVGPALIARIADAVILLNEGDVCNELTDSSLEFELFNEVPYTKPREHYNYNEDNQQKPDENFDKISYVSEKGNTNCDLRFETSIEKLNNIETKMNRMTDYLLTMNTSISKNITQLQAEVVKMSQDFKAFKGTFSKTIHVFVQQFASSKKVDRLENMIFGLCVAFVIIMTSVFYLGWKMSGSIEQ